MATAREKQDAAHADYRLAKTHEHALVNKRGLSDTGIPLIVERDDIELRSAIEADLSAQLALSAALRATDD